jgi:hypothetical protein
MGGSSASPTLSWTGPCETAVACRGTGSPKADWLSWPFPGQALAGFEPGGGGIPTALAARIAVVWIGSSWTNASGWSYLNGTARW